MSSAHLDLAGADPQHLADPIPPAVAWAAGGGLEPSLAELLEDPIMVLLWASDGLDPAAARATMRSLQALVRDQGRREPQARQGCQDAGTVLADLAA
jgi:hypothetical protein